MARSGTERRRVREAGCACKKRGAPGAAVRASAATATVVVAVVVIVVVLVSAEGTGVVDHLAVHHGEDRTDLPHVRVAYAEVVAVEHDQVAELALLDGAHVVFAIEVPRGAARIAVERLLAADLLPGVDLLSEDVETRGRVVHREPGVMRRDVHAVLVQAGGDTARQDLREERTEGQPVGARHAV